MTAAIVTAIMMMTMITIMEILSKYQGDFGYEKAVKGGSSIEKEPNWCDGLKRHDMNS
jgi:hypothetical protein